MIGILGGVVYLYLSWRMMKENYQEEDMVAFGWVTLIAFLVGSRIAYTLTEPKLWLEFWKMGESNTFGGYILWLLLTWLITSDRGWRFFAFGEDSLINLGWINLIFFIISGQWKLIILLTIVAMIGCLIKGRYRSYPWYKSGKKGFLFLALNILFFIGLSVVFLNYYYLIMALISVVGLVMLGNERYSK